MMRMLCGIGLLMVGLGSIAGCGASAAAGLSPESFVVVKGQVVMDNRPLDGAMLNFFPLEAKLGDGATAVTDASGNYELTTSGAKGVLPGSYRVIISRLVDPAGKPVVATVDTPPANLGAIESLPTRYSDYTASTLNVKVAPQGGTFDFKLTSK